MTTPQDIRSVVHRLAAEAFKVPVESIAPELTPFDVEGWDSLSQLQLVVEVEKAFNVVFDAEDVFRIVSIGSVIELIEEKLERAA